MDERSEIATKIEDLKARKQELEESLPAHSIKPHHIMQIEELEDEIELLTERLETLK
jgi:chromosome segregation ATPase